ncbi:MAG TPA: protein translocase subunit SecF [Kineosporiaceae bacterium]|nr:protein translocase subunit SecF [Kineosporiaceae bacterium]
MPSFAQFGNDLYAGRRSFEFVGNRKRWYAIAAVAVLISLLGLGIRGLNPGLEFRGGSEFRILHVHDTSQATAEKAVTGVVPGADVRVSSVGSDNIRIQTDKLTAQQTDKVVAALASTYSINQDQISQSFVGPSWGQDVTSKAGTSLAVFLILVAAVIALYFRTWKMAVAGLVALVHDLLITVGVYALVGFEVTPASVIGFLTILGYSLYDTVVVFDKVRENTDHITATTRRTFGEAANLAVNQTLVRSINTSVVALLPVASILFIGAFVLGAGTLKDIALSLFVGIAVGTYSSIFIATPLLAHLREREPELAQQAERVRRKRAEAAERAEAGAGEGLVASGVGAAAVAAPAGAPSVAGDEAGARGGQRQQPRRGNRPSGRKR